MMHPRSSQVFVAGHGLVLAVLPQNFHLFAGTTDFPRISGKRLDGDVVQALTWHRK